MKNEKIKIMTFAFAMLFAVVTAFGTISANETGIVTGKYDPSGNQAVCTVDFQCSDVPGTTCISTTGQPVFQNNGTSCQIQLSRLP